MKALVYNGVKTLEYQEYADPIVDNDNLIDIKSVGICGSDMHAYLGHDARRPAPLILGHEAAGIVLEGPLKGKRVTINPLVSCGECRFCNEDRENLCVSRQIISMPPRKGAFAERVAMPTRNLVEIPDTISYDHASLAEPLAVCWHAVRLAKEALYGELSDAKCLIQGGGAIGLGAALSLAAMGAKHIAIAELNEIRRDVLSNAGDFDVFDPREKAIADSSYDVVIDAVGMQATRAEASRIVQPGGVIAHIGLGDSNDGLDIRRVTLQEITFIGTYTYTAQDFKDTAQAMFDGLLGDFSWIETRALSGGAQAFADILAGHVAAPKIVLNP